VHRVVCPGSFDPVTNGHLDIIARAAGLYDEVIAAVLINVTKKSLFTVDERVEMLTDVTSGYGNVRVERFHGLLVDFCAANGITAVIKGLRAVSDFEYEMQMAQMNYRMAKVETLFITTNPLYSFLSSSLVKEIATYGGDVSGLVPDTVLSRLRARLAQELPVRSPGSYPPVGRAPPKSLPKSSPFWGIPRSAGTLDGRFRLAIHASTLSCPTHAPALPEARLYSICAPSAARQARHERGRSPFRPPRTCGLSLPPCPPARPCGSTSGSRR
jgi:pantetheine-phosphate adenylyltransferase